MMIRIKMIMGIVGQEEGNMFVGSFMVRRIVESQAKDLLMSIHDYICR